MDHVTRVKWNSGKGTRVCRLNVAVVLFFFVTQHCLDVYCSVLRVKPCAVSLLWLAAVLLDVAVCPGMKNTQSCLPAQVKEC